MIKEKIASKLREWANNLAVDKEALKREQEIAAENRRTLFIESTVSFVNYLKLVIEHSEAALSRNKQPRFCLSDREILNFYAMVNGPLVTIEEIVSSPDVVASVNAVDFLAMFKISQFPEWTFFAGNRFIKNNFPAIEP